MTIGEVSLHRDGQGQSSRLLIYDLIAHPGCDAWFGLLYNKSPDGVLD